MKPYFKVALLIICCIWSLTPGMLLAQTLTLPKPDGDYSVGIQSIEIKDITRKSIRNSEDRKWIISLFYPTTPHDERSPYMPGTIADGFIQGTRVLTHSKLDANPIETNEKFPVIIFIPGRGELRQKYTILCEHLASKGYLIIAMDQPYASSFVKFIDGETRVLTFKDAWRLRRDRDYRYAYDDLIIKHALEDIDYTLTHPNILGRFRKICDFNKVVLIGHSLGGNIAHIMGFHDHRITAVVDIDSKITERQVYRKIGIPNNQRDIPVLFIRGMMQYQEDVGDSLHKIKNATIWQPMVQHSAFSDNAYLAHYIKNFGTTGILSGFWNWVFKKGPHFDPIDTNVGKYDINIWYKEYCTCVSEWLEEHIP